MTSPDCWFTRTPFGISGERERLARDNAKLRNALLLATDELRKQRMLITDMKAISDRWAEEKATGADNPYRLPL